MISIIFVHESEMLHTVVLIVMSDIVFHLIILFYQDGRTPLILAVAMGQSDTVSLLIVSGADINVEGNVSERVLICICTHLSNLPSYCDIHRKYHYVL